MRAVIIYVVIAVVASVVGFWASGKLVWPEPTVQVWIYYDELQNQYQADGDYRFLLEGWWSNEGQFFECTVSQEFYNAVIYSRTNAKHTFPARVCREVLP